MLLLGILVLLSFGAGLFEALDPYLRHTATPHLLHLETVAADDELVAELRNAIERVHEPSGNRFVRFALFDRQAKLFRLVGRARPGNNPFVVGQLGNVLVFAEVRFVYDFADDFLNDVFDGN